MEKKYKNAKAPRSAIEDKLRSIVNKEGGDIQRLRKQVSFDRLLARLFHRPGSAWYLKGGYAMQHRLRNARGTKDVDLALKELKFDSSGPVDQGLALLEILREESARDLDDFFELVVTGPILDLDAPPYGGGRFLIESKLDNRVFEKFHLDIGIGDVWLEPLDSLETRAWISGFESQRFSAISKEQHIAEKIHACTVPRTGGRENSRVKDLIDLALLSQEQINATTFKKAIAETFKRRATHEFNPTLNPPPPSWNNPYLPAILAFQSLL
ncbi:MAG: nucleotidyl transferase AbiEii/AbiGii toxin family protein [Bdellovibrionales bacterium]|nr:nucleotidyl transferase AbiEii/AbiGii toxin family protein [Bdellovibrionales bacterium]